MSEARELEREIAVVVGPVDTVRALQRRLRAMKRKRRYLSPTKDAEAIAFRDAAQWANDCAGSNPFYPGRTDERWASNWLRYFQERGGKL